MVFIETPIFTASVRFLLDDDSYARLQRALACRPDAGALISGTGGLRKLRWGHHGRGKRGGVRIIYYWSVSAAQIMMLANYPKSKRDDLTADQKLTLRKIVEQWK